MAALAAISGERSLVLSGEIRHHLGIGNHGMFDHLGQPLAENPVWQGVEQRRVGDHEAGLMKRADEVLAQGTVDSGLAADGTVDLRDHGGRNLDDRDASVMDRGDKSGQITDHAPSEREDGTLAIQSQFDEAVAQGGRGPHRLGGFPPAR